MRHIIGIGSAVLITTLLATAPTAVAVEDSFIVDRLAEGVHLFRPAAPGYARTNSLVVEQASGLVVINAQPSPDAARQLLEAIDARLQRSPRFLVLPHPHAEAAGGASAYPESTVVLAAPGFVQAMADPSFDFGAEMRARVNDPDGWVEPPRPRVDVVVHQGLTLADERHPLEVLAPAPIHTPGDLYVKLPSIELIVAGSVVFPDGNPYAGHANVSSWISQLNHLIRSRPKITVPLSGEPLGPDALTEQRNNLAWLQGRVDEMFVRRPPLDVMREQVLSSEGIEARFDVDAQPSFLPGMVDRLIEEGIAFRKKRGRW